MIRQSAVRVDLDLRIVAPEPVPELVDQGLLDEMLRECEQERRRAMWEQKLDVAYARLREARDRIAALEADNDDLRERLALRYAGAGVGHEPPSYP